MVKTILELTESELEPEILNQATGEIRRQYLKGEKARKVLGWEPTLTLEKGLERTIEWYRALLATTAPPSKPHAK